MLHLTLMHIHVSVSHVSVFFFFQFRDNPHRTYCFFLVLFFIIIICLFLFLVCFIFCFFFHEVFCYLNMCIFVNYATQNNSISHLPNPNVSSTFHFFYKKLQPISSIFFFSFPSSSSFSCSHSPFLFFFSSYRNQRQIQNNFLVGQFFL